MLKLMIAEILECMSCPCNNGAICIEDINDYMCRCGPGWKDKNCSTGKCSYSS